jgi:hypothetical protein
MAIRNDFAPGEVLAAADLNDTFGSKLDLAGGKILQVVQATTAAGATSTSASYADTNLSVTITPQYNNSKVLIIVNQQGLASTAAADLALRIVRTSTAVLTQTWTFASNTGTVCSMSYLDSPATDLATTYKTQFARTSGSGSIIVQIAGLTSIITALEVSG